MSAIPMPVPRPTSRPEEFVYPESDGKPMADNTKQFEWIQVLQGNLAALYRDDKVFVAGDLFWYPVEKRPKIVNAPDVLLAFGRPKGHRGSYRQWEEQDVAPQVVFEVLSPSNTYLEMIDKQFFYEEHGVEEYYVFDPDNKRLVAHLRRNDLLRPIHVSLEFVSPRMKIRFDLSGDEMAVFYPDGRRFLTFEALEAERARERQLRLDAEQRAGDAEQRADDASKRAGDASKRADDASKRADDAEQRVRRLAELGRKARHGEATHEEIAELERLEDVAS